MSDNKNIIIKGARVNNLKNIDVEIPRNKFVVITGLSGSGKSSLAFDTLYAEGQRRYVESLSSYARQFLGCMPKPECDFIKGLPPAIAIEQKVNTRNSRSTVGTSTEVYDYLRLLFSRIGRTYSPVSGEEVKKHTAEDIITTLNSLPTGTRFAILTEIPNNIDFTQQLNRYLMEGYSRLEFEGKFIQISDILSGAKEVNPAQATLLIDRLSVSSDREQLSRLYDSIETAFYIGNQNCNIKVWEESGINSYHFSKSFEADGITFTEPTEMMFNFNNPIGACPKCEGYGKVTGIDEDLVIPNKTLSVYEDAVFCWRGNVMSEWKNDFIRIAQKHNFPIHRPYYQLTDTEKNLLWNGDNTHSGINGFFTWINSKTYNIQYRVLLARYRGKTLCPDCLGSRLRKEALYVRVGEKTIYELVRMPVRKLQQWFNDLELSEHDSVIAKRILIEIKNRLGYLFDVGLGYLTLDRISSTLSGGESQRINLASSLGSSLIGSLYILDEPSIGLHSRDTDKLINILRMLRDLGNTVVVVEHDEEIIRASDHLIDIGPDAGRNGGELIYSDTFDPMAKSEKSYTLKYLNGKLEIPTPKFRRSWRNYIQVKGAAHNNLKGIDVKFPLGVMTVVTGVSGSGKSTLVKDILYRAVARHFDIAVDAPGTHSEIIGDLKLIHGVEFVDQNPIGKTSRSNAATYLKAFDEIRRLYADQPRAKQMGYNASYFSFNSPGGRCEECKGEGTISIEMQFMADIEIECEECKGKRYNSEILEIEYQKCNISDILQMTVNQAIEFFSQNPSSTERKIIKRLKPLQDVGLGYIKLGQSSSTLSGGENQRVKLA
ncbi:MAG: excinuclease ABC subunit UvrA, partial [Bacteroidales bacterium]